MKRILGFALLAVGLACLGFAVREGVARDGFPWFGWAGPVIAVAGLLIAGAKPRPPGPFNTGEQGQA